MLCFPQRDLSLNVVPLLCDTISLSQYLWVRPRSSLYNWGTIRSGRLGPDSQILDYPEKLAKSKRSSLFRSAVIEEVNFFITLTPRQLSLADDLVELVNLLPGTLFWNEKHWSWNVFAETFYRMPSLTLYPAGLLVTNYVLVLSLLGANQGSFHIVYFILPQRLPWFSQNFVRTSKGFF